MSQAVVIGIDVGTTNLKLAALDADGRVVARAAVGYGVCAAEGGVVTQEAGLWWRGLETCLADAGRQCALDGVKALALSCQGETLVCCDGEGTALEPAISWMDTRAGAEMQELAASHKDWYARTGKPIAAYSTLSKICWLKKHRPELYGRVRRFCQVADYLVARLTGRWLLDISNAAFTSLFDIRGRRWDEELCARFDLADRLPPVAESGSVAGSLRPELARRWGLPADIKVVLGGHDQGCAALGAAPPDELAVIVSTGTAWVLYSPMRQPQLDPGERIIVYCHAQPGMWAGLAAYSGGGVLDTFLRQFCNGGHEGAGLDYDRLLDEKNLAEDLVVIPYLFGANTPENDPRARAAILNLGPHHTPGHIAMGIMEAIGFETRRNLELLRGMGVTFDRVRMVGGACRSRLWPQLVADICALPVDAMEEMDAAPLGAAFLAGQAVGVWRDSRLPRYPATKTCHVNEERARRMDRKYQRYLRTIEMERSRRDAEANQPENRSSADKNVCFTSNFGFRDQQA